MVVKVMNELKFVTADLRNFWKLTHPDLCYFDVRNITEPDQNRKEEEEVIRHLHNPSP